MYLAENEDGIKHFAGHPDERIFALKPMNCPCHVQIFNQGLKSYRDLPMRLAEFGSCHRFEPSGALHGIMRVRNFTQDDAHIFCTPEQVKEESLKFCRLLFGIYHDCGFSEVQIRFADRPQKRAGSDAGVGRGRGAAEGRDRRRQPSVRDGAGRRRVLRPEARVPPQGHDRPHLAMRHAADGFRAARAARRQLRRARTARRSAR